MLIPFSYILDKLCGISAHDGARGNVLGDYGSSGNDGILADGHAWQDDGTHANPGVATDVDGFAAQHHTVLEVVIVGDDAHVGAIITPSSMVMPPAAIQVNE